MKEKTITAIMVEPGKHPKVVTLDKPGRRIVLQIIDAKDQITEDSSFYSFIAGLNLACQLCRELPNIPIAFAYLQT